MYLLVMHKNQYEPVWSQSVSTTGKNQFEPSSLDIHNNQWETVWARKNQFELVTASFNSKEEPVHSQFEPSSLDIHNQ